MRSLVILMISLLIPLVAQASQRATESTPGNLEELPPITVALGYANSLVTCGVAQDMEPAWDLAGGCYIWQQPGVALSITAEWSDFDVIPVLHMDPELIPRFFKAQSNLVNAAPFHYPSEAEYGSDDPAIDDMVCLLQATDAAKRYTRHLDSYKQWIGYNPGMDFIEPGVYNPHAAVVFIHSGGAVEFYFGFDENDEVRLMHLMVYDYFSA